MNEGLRDEIDSFIEERFSEERHHDLEDALSLFDAFEYAGIYQKLSDVLGDLRDEEADSIELKFLGAFEESYAFLFGQHQITLESDVSFSIQNEILGVLYRLQNSEDPVPVLRLLESSFSEEEIFAKIVESFSMVDEATVLSSVKEIEPSSLRILQTFLYQKETMASEEEQLDPETKAQLVKNLKDFFEVHGKEALAFEMITNGIEVGYTLKLYYPFIKDVLVTEDDTTTAKNLLSFFFLGSDTFNDPLKVYQQQSETLFHSYSSERIMRVEVLLGKLLNDLRQYQKAHHDAKRISAT